MKPKRLILVFIPNNKCNLHCEYCYISQMKKWGKSEAEMPYSPEYIVKALSAERLGGPSLVNLTGQGETLLYSGIVTLTKGLLLEGHAVEIVTNGITRKVIKELLELPSECLNRLEFKISFHYEELLEKNLLDHFFENISMIQNSPASFSLELMPYDKIEDSINDINELCITKVGAKCHATVGRADSELGRGLLTNHTKEKYKEIWSVLDSEMFHFKMKLIDVRRREFCYAGSWTLLVDMSTGEARQCYGQPVNQNIFKNLKKPIHFVPVGYHCVQPYCINGHAHLTLGCIPELKTPTYEEIRNRKCVDGSEWFSDECKQCFTSKLYDTNKQYKQIEKYFHTLMSPFQMLYWMIRNWNKTKEMVKVQMRRIRNRNGNKK